MVRIVEQEAVPEREYVAVINFDYSRPHATNAYQKIITALLQAGWHYVETSALTYDGPDLGPILVALDLLARALPTGGTLSALTVQVQLLGAEGEYKAANNHPNALEQCRAMPRPEPN